MNAAAWTQASQPSSALRTDSRSRMSPAPRSRAPDRCRATRTGVRASRRRARAAAVRVRRRQRTRHVPADEPGATGDHHPHVAPPDCRCVPVARSVRKLSPAWLGCGSGSWARGASASPPPARSIMQGLAGRVTLYDRAGIRARGEALDYLHALPLLPSTEIRGRSYDEFEPDDVMIITVRRTTSSRGDPPRRARRQRRDPRPHRERDGGRRPPARRDRGDQPARRAHRVPRAALGRSGGLDHGFGHVARHPALRRAAGQRVRGAPAQHPRVGDRRARRLVGVPVQQRDHRRAAAAGVRRAARHRP